MNLGVMLDVVIGMVFIYFLLALIASGIQEVIAAIFAWRGTYLAKGIDVILDNDSSATFAWAGVGDFLKAHFTPGPAESVSQTTLKNKIDNEQGGTATPAQEKLKTLQAALRKHPLMRGTPTDLPSYVPARNFALSLLETLRDGSQSPLFSQAERSVAALPDGDLKQTLTVYLQDASGDIDAFRTHLETWFDDAMDRVSGVYKRFSQYVMLTIGLLLAVTLNVDSVLVARHLWETPSLRSAIVANAEKAANQAVPAAGGTEDAASAMKGVLANVRNFEDQQLPIGWDALAGSESPAPLPKLIGWLFTAAAIGLGAPFWFSLLQSLTNIRNAGPAPKRADAAP